MGWLCKAWSGGSCGYINCFVLNVPFGVVCFAFVTHRPFTFGPHGPAALWEALRVPRKRCTRCGRAVRLRPGWRRTVVPWNVAQMRRGQGALPCPAPHLPPRRAPTGLDQGTRPCPAPTSHPGVRQQATTRARRPVQRPTSRPGGLSITNGWSIVVFGWNQQCWGLRLDSSVTL